MRSNKEYSLTIITILKEFQSNLNLEKGFLKTVIDLIIRPNKVITSYIENKRDLYFSPARLLITIISLIAIYSSIFGFDNTGIPIDNFKDYGKTTSFLLQFLYETPMLYSFLAIIPLSILSRLVFWKANRNLAMNLVANIYLIIILVFSMLILGEISGILSNQEIIPESSEDVYMPILVIIVLVYYFRSYMKFLDIISIVSFLKLFLILISFIICSVIIGDDMIVNAGNWRVNWKVVFYVLGTPIALCIILFLIKKMIKFIKNNRLANK
jgi:hypothetical protein